MLIFDFAGALCYNPPWKRRVTTAYGKARIAGKLRRRKGYPDGFELPARDSIPDIGLYMEQAALLKDCLDYLPPELKEEQRPLSAAFPSCWRKKSCCLTMRHRKTAEASKSRNHNHV